ncbi:MAG TPA: ABC transporter permease subunit [Methylomirabilota bacterium]|nr:ABC transporter permease subunit [Methylomirabilota bacterium]
MNTATIPASAVRLPDIAFLAAARKAWHAAWAIAGVVIRELCRRKDFYVLFVLTALITLVMGSVTFFGEEDVARYLKEICLFLIWVSSLVIAVTTTARQIPAERENRTLLPLLAKPVTRSQLLLGKFLGCWLATGLTLVVFYLFFGVVAGTREHAWPVLNYFQAAVLHWFMLGIVCAMTLLGSIVFAAPSSNNTITLVVCVGILLVGRHLNKVALRLDEPSQTLLYAVYYAIPHLEFFDVRDLIVHNWPLIRWDIWAAALGYAVVYAALFLGLACLAFRRKTIY